ncbi:MAG: hypothetical protein ACOYXM_17210 [Actinomycetota bacterium]
MGSPARRGAQALAAAGASVAIALAACADRGSEPVGAAPSLELFGAQATAVGDELWVFGGVAGPDGSSPPVTSRMPPGWGPNLRVTAYSPDGEVVRLVTLPIDGRRSLVGGRVLRTSGVVYLLSSTCDGGFGCGGVADPLLLRFDGERVEEVRLDLPRADYGTQVGGGLLTVLGHTGSTAWALQRVADPSGTAYVPPQRLLAIELTNGRATEVALPPGLYGTEVLCLGEGQLFAAQADLDDRVNLTAVRILRRHAGVEASVWEEMSEQPIDRGFVGAGGLLCLEDHAELVVWLDGFPTVVTTLSMTTGAATAAHATPSNSAGLELLGVVEGDAVLGSRTDDGARILWRHRPGSWEQIANTNPPRPSRLIVLDGRLYDVSGVLRRSDPDRGELVPLDL